MIGWVRQWWQQSTTHSGRKHGKATSREIEAAEIGETEVSKEKSRYKNNTLMTYRIANRARISKCIFP